MFDGFVARATHEQHQQRTNDAHYDSGDPDRHAHLQEAARLVALVDDDVCEHPRREDSRQHAEVQQLWDASVAVAPADEGAPRTQGTEPFLEVHIEEAVEVEERGVTSIQQNYIGKKWFNFQRNKQILNMIDINVSLVKSGAIEVFRNAFPENLTQRESLQRCLSSNYIAVHIYDTSLSAC